VVYFTQLELVWRDQDSLLRRKFGIVLPLLVVSIYGLACNPSLLFVDGVILSRYFFNPYISNFQRYRSTWIELKWALVCFFFFQRPLARRLWILIQRVEGVYRAASFGNLLIFLCTGRWFISTTKQFTQHIFCFFCLCQHTKWKFLFMRNENSKYK